MPGFTQKGRKILRNRKLPFFGLIVTLALITCISSFAGEGVFLLGNDALQLGRASSGVASPRSAYWSYMNPASMVDLERRFDINWYTVFSDITFEPRGILGNHLNDKLESKDIYYIASTGMVWPTESGAIGGGIFIPSGSGVEYPYSRNIVSRLFQGNHDRRLTYQHIRGVIAYAHEFDNGWALGLGLHLSLSRFRSDHLTLRFMPAQYGNEWDDAYGAGFGLGVYRSWERFSVGASYSSRHWTKPMDEYEDLLHHSLDTPHVIQAGIAYKITPKVEVTLDYKWLNWKKIGTYGTPLFHGGGFGWADQHGVKAGIEWIVNPKWTLMAGYAYSNTPITDDNVFLGALVPVTIEQHVTAGVSYKINEKHQIHLVGIYALNHKMTENGEGDLFSKIGKGSTLEAGGISAVLGYSYLW